MTQPLALFGGPPAVPDPPRFSWPPIGERDIARVVALLERGELSYYGREGEAERLERAFAEYIGVRHALSVTSGTAALHSAFFGLGLGAGDEVLAPTFTFLSTVMPLFVVNATPVLVDADARTGNIDPADIERRITPRTRAIVVAHLCGHPCDMDPIVAIARRHGLRIVEDCAQAHGAEYRGRRVGSIGDVSIFSLQASKLVAGGQGGLLLTDDREIFERATLLGHFRVRSFQDVQSPEYAPFASTGYGLNYRIHPFAAALAMSQLERLDEYIDNRRERLGRLSRVLDGARGIEPPALEPYVTRHGQYSYKPLYRPDEMGGLPIDAYLRALRAEGVPIAKSETLPLHLEPLFQVEDDRSRTYGRALPGAPALRRRYRAGDLPTAETYARLALKLPPYTDDVGDAFERFAEAFDKVARHVDELLAHAAGAHPIGSTPAAAPAPPA
jgi:perosamine synthetase